METDFFLYRSQTDLGPADEGCAAILTEARDRNARMNLTGYLHQEDGVFYQWLEGPQDALAEVAEMIERDPRHRDIRYLWRGSQPQRQFAEWRMGFGISQPGALFDWVVESGVSTTNEVAFARALLSFMQSDSIRSVARLG